MLLSGNKAVLMKTKESKGKFFFNFQKTYKQSQGTEVSLVYTLWSDVPLLLCLPLPPGQRNNDVHYICSTVFISLSIYAQTTPLKKMNLFCDCLLCDMLYNLTYI